MNETTLDMSGVKAALDKYDGIIDDLRAACHADASRDELLEMLRLTDKAMDDARVAFYAVTKDRNTLWKCMLAGPIYLRELVKKWEASLEDQR